MMEYVPNLMYLNSVPRIMPNHPHPKNKFSAEEDQRLISLIQQYGEDNWSTISDKMPKRNPRQCRERWFNYLSPEINTRPWSIEEDTQLKRLYDQYGPKWVKIATYFPQRTDINVKNRWLVLFRQERRLQRKALGIKINRRSKRATQLLQSQIIGQIPNFIPYQSILTKPSSTPIKTVSNPLDEIPETTQLGDNKIDQDDTKNDDFDDEHDIFGNSTDIELWDESFIGIYPPDEIF